MKKCPYCPKEITAGSAHIYSCGNKKYPDKTKEIIKKEFVELNFSHISNKQNLILEYETNLQSLPDLKKTYGIDFKSIIFLLDFYKIKKRTIDRKSTRLNSSHAN